MSSKQHQERLLTVILGPHVSEKATDLAERGQVVFRVRTDATKPEIREAIETLFEVSVESVHTVNQAGKVKRHGRSMGQRSAWKKAYVRLAEGHDIDFLGAE